jgi:hypothetical protein
MAQLMQAFFACSCWYCPAVQSLHGPAPPSSAKYWPTKQSVHADIFAVAAIFPATHLMHDAWTVSAWYCPARQSMQGTAPPSSAKYSPASQSVHAVIFAVAATFPTTHLMHDV